MTSNAYHIAELNIARMLAPLDDPIMAEFVANLDRINSLGMQSPGFVWILKDESGTNSATDIRPFEDERIIVNMTVWENIEALFNYTYYSDHTDFFRRRAAWFEKLEFGGMVLWWIPAGHIPTVEEAKARLEYLQQHGPTPYAFTFKKRYTPLETEEYMETNAVS